MGDRVYAAVRIGGHIETIQQADDLIAAIVSEGVECQHSERRADSPEATMILMRFAIEQGGFLDLQDAQVNYGTFDQIETIIRQTPNLWCTTTYEAGDEFGEGVKTILHVDGELTIWDAATADGEPLVGLSPLRSLLTSEPETIAHKLRELVAEVGRATGDGLPPLTASPQVAAYLTILGRAA